MAELQSLNTVPHAIQTVALATLIFAVCVFFTQINFYAQFRKIPAYAGNPGSSKKRQTAYLESARKFYEDGYKQFSNSVYRMAGTETLETVVVPPAFLPELRRQPDDVLSFPHAVNETMETKYTKLDTNEPLGMKTIKADLTPALARLNPTICVEVDEAMKAEMPACDDWTNVSIYMTLVRIIAKVSGRVFVGPELCRNQDYLDAGINYTMELIAAQREIKKVRPMLRPFLAPRLPEVKRLRKREEEAKVLLEPIVQARLDALKKPGFEKPDDMLQWFINRGEGADLHKLAKLQLGVIFAAIHTTSLTVTNIMYTLAVMPEYFKPLRDEIASVMAAHGGVITSKALQEMVKLDSYMKEVTRFYPAGITSFSRKVMKGFYLSNGQYLPAGVSIEVPSAAIYQDDANYPNPEKFDGFRFSELRKQNSVAAHARNQFVTTNEQNLGFGYGAHACPGRFFAANEIKMILARAILEYEWKNEDGSMERYPNLEQGRQTAPDPRKLLSFKKVKA
ncbi:cytochrome P450 monooxygenase-like protein [Lophiotrema nucula]|uniref:Cytochrome P450 monooxygenase-like protein n=1 Tax=Lophiotrema nucula TaxID=690887 RepID=A0A6A5ZCW8_9PLEO|nr:cytochrome P450 monooxygenase-like protein [Lophiotrema nucula]